MIIKNLTTKNCEALNIKRAPNFDFEDDGNHFRGFLYKGRLPITVLYSKTLENVFLAIRVDYLENEFTYNEWHDTAEYHLCNKFNPTTVIDTDDLVDTLERVLNRVDSLNEECAKMVVDKQPIIDAITTEIKGAKETVDEFKRNFKWYEYSAYHLDGFLSTLHSLEKEILRAETILANLTGLGNEIESKRLRAYMENVKMGKPVCLTLNGYYIRKLKDALNK